MSFPRYEAYKDSGVEWLGEVPEHWRVSKLKFLTKQIVDGAHFTPTYIDNGIPFLRVTDIQNASLDTDEFKFIPKNEHEELIKRCKPEKGDLLLSKNGTIGIPRLIDWDWEFSIFVSLCLIKFVTALDARYAYFFFLSHQIKEQINSQIKQSTVINLHLDKIENFIFPLPFLEEQAQIAHFLDHETARIDALIAEQERLIELLKEKRQAVISHAVTKGLDPTAPMRDSGVEWLGEVPEHWRVCRVKNVASFITSGPRGWSDYIDDSATDIFLQSGDLDDQLNVNFKNAKRISSPEGAEGVRTRIYDGDVLVCITGANTGRVAVINSVDETAYINQHLGLIRPIASKCYSRYLGYSLAAAVCQTYFGVEQYGLKVGLSLTDLSEAPLALPPLSEQVQLIEQVESAIARLDRLEIDAERTILLLKERRAALISAAVTGKIDVRDWKAPTSASPAATLEVVHG